MAEVRGHDAASAGGRGGVVGRFAACVGCDRRVRVHCGSTVQRRVASSPRHRRHSSLLRIVTISVLYFKLAIGKKGCAAVVYDRIVAFSNTILGLMVAVCGSRGGCASKTAIFDALRWS